MKLCECCGYQVTDSYQPYGEYCNTCGDSVTAPTGDGACHVQGDGRRHTATPLPRYVVAVIDEHTCPTCRDLDGKQVGARFDPSRLCSNRQDDEIRCRCTVVAKPRTVMRFRFHRGSLADSMATARTFTSRTEFLHALREQAGLWASPSDQEFASNLGFVLYGDGPDGRIGWERTYLVTLSGSPIGFADCVPADLPETVDSRGLGDMPVIDPPQPEPAGAAPAESAPFIASRPEVGEFSGIDRTEGQAPWPASSRATIAEDVAKVAASMLPAGVGPDGSIVFAAPAPGTQDELGIIRDINKLATLVATMGPEVEHPAPWRWGPASYPQPDEFGRPETLALFDAAGEEIIGTDGDDWSWVAVDSPRVRALVELAPDMEALLRRLADDEGKTYRFKPNVAEDARELLARIDESSKGGA